MSKQATTAIMVTLPDDLVAVIDNIIEYGIYSNRPDLIVNSLRKILDDSRIMSLSPTDKTISVKFTERKKEFVESVNLDLMFIEKYGRKQDTVSIMIKVPPAIITDMVMFSVPALSRKNFCKYSVVELIKNLIPGWNYTFSTFEGNMAIEKESFLEAIRASKPSKTLNTNNLLYDLVLAEQFNEQFNETLGKKSAKKKVQLEPLDKEPPTN